MFGYLQIQKSELLVREYDAYKAVYCGLCKQMGKDYSFLARFGLSYDCTFYAMMIMAVKRTCTGFKDARCTCNPLKKCKFALCSSDVFSKASAFSVISAYYKLKDDILDSGFFKKLLCRCLKPIFSHWRKKAVKTYSELDSFVSQMMDLQYKAEHGTDNSIDNAAHPTAFMMGNVFALEAEDEMQKRVFYEFGYHLGRWVYFIDAADDIKKDKKSGNFNPFNNIYINKTEEKDYIANILNQSLARAYDAYNLIDFIDFKGILDNMMLKGFPAAQNRVISKLNSEVTDE